MSKNPFSKVQKTFSVCTPVYKEAYETFPKFFQALSEQSYPHFEVIITFDGENKKGERALAKEVKKYPNLTISHHTIPHGGAPAARNNSARYAKGDFLTFLDPDIYLFPETLQFWAGCFDEHPEKDVVWGMYDVSTPEGGKGTIGAVPMDNGGNVDYWVFRSSNYCSGAFPVRKEAFVGWDERVQSLQDWDMWIRMLIEDNFKGDKFFYVPRSFFITDPPHAGGISDDSHKNWLERVAYVKEKNGIPKSRGVVCSLGAPFHAINTSKILGWDFLVMPSYKPHQYEAVYLLGFYPATHESRMAHLGVFAGDGAKAKKIIHWIGTDIYQMDRTISLLTFRELKKIWDDEQFILLSEANHTYTELFNLGITTTIVPIPPHDLFDTLPLPEEFTVAIYENPTSKMYSEALMQEIVRSMPDVQFKFFGDDEKKAPQSKNCEHLGWIDLKEWMPRFSCNLRITIHDGLPLTPLQFLTAGRNVVANIDLDGVITVEGTRKKIVEGIRKAQDSLPDLDIGTRWRDRLKFETYRYTMEDFLNTMEDYL